MPLTGIKVIEMGHRQSRCKQNVRKCNAGYQLSIDIS